MSECRLETVINYLITNFTFQILHSLSMISKIIFKNYKIFKEEQELEIKPITILFGKNNSGKSAIAKLPTLIEASLKGSSLDSVSVLNDGVELGSEFKDLVYNQLKPLEIELQTLIDGEISSLKVGILMTEIQKRSIAKIESWQLSNQLSLIAESRDNEYKDELRNKLFYCRFGGFMINSIIPTTTEEPYYDVNINNFKFITDYIGPIRATPKRIYELAKKSIDKIGIAGENTPYSLIDDVFTTERILINQVSKWYEENFEGWKLYIDEDRAPIYQIELRRNELKQNIKDTGIGMSQVLPIVTRAFKHCEEDTLIIIEEPETHLHPAAHGNLAQLLVETIKQGNKHYLVETHSQNFILRLRRLVAENILKREDLAIYYVEFDEETNTSCLRKIEVDEWGRVSFWPEGMFSETLDETIAIGNVNIEIDNKW